MLRPIYRDASPTPVIIDEGVPLVPAALPAQIAETAQREGKRKGNKVRQPHQELQRMRHGAGGASRRYPDHPG